MYRAFLIGRVRHRLRVNLQNWHRQVDGRRLSAAVRMRSGRRVGRVVAVLEGIGDMLIGNARSLVSLLAIRHSHPIRERSYSHRIREKCDRVPEMTA